jgi:hypothetical protein
MEAKIDHERWLVPLSLYLRDVDMMIDEIDEELYRGDRRETAINLVYHHVP